MEAVIFDYGRTLFDRETDAFFPEVGQVLDYLFPKYKLAIVSIATEKDSSSSRLEALERAGMRKYFSPIYFDEKEKDHLFERVLKDFSVSPSQVVIVDDRVTRGIIWGNKKGAMTIWLRKGKFADELPDEETGEPTHIIENLLALRQLL